MILDASARGTIMTVDVKQATRIIDALVSTDSQAQHDTHNATEERDA